MIAYAAKQYMQLKMLYTQAKEQKDLLKAINDGINLAIGMIKTLPIKDENILGHLKDFQKAINEIEKIYGEVPPGQDANMIILHDQTIAESIKIANILKEYAESQEQNANKALDRIDSASPKGAQKIEVQTTAAILHTLNQILRVNGQMLKLQSEQLGLMNKDSKEENYHFNKVNKDLKSSFNNFKGSFDTPRF